jgi:hypothetical protein
MVKEALDLRQRYDSIVKNTMGGMWCDVRAAAKIQLVHVDNQNIRTTRWQNV